MKVINAWKGSILDNQGIKDKIREYAVRTENYDFDFNTELDFLLEHDHWFDAIFNKNIEP